MEREWHRLPPRAKLKVIRPRATAFSGKISCEDLKTGRYSLVYCVRTTEVLDILVAEDNPDDVFFLQEAFRKAGVRHNLRVVCDGVETLDYLKGENSYTDRAQNPFPNVLLLDLNMPRVNGFEVLELMRQDVQCKSLVVHVISASAREADVQRAYELGANSYIVKPSRMDELVKFVSALDQWHQLISLPPRLQNQKSETQRAA